MAEQEILTPETLTKAHIGKWSVQEFRKQMNGPLRDTILKIISSLNLAEVEQIEQQQNASPVTDEAAEQAALAAAEQQRQQQEAAAAEAERQRLAAEEAARPKKFVIDYQVKDENGENIGRPTHLEASSEEELRGKIIEAHVQATRAFHRLKKQKVTFKQEQPAQVAQPMSNADMLQAMTDLKSSDPNVALEAQKRITKATVDAELAAERQAAAEQKEAARQAQVSYQFLIKHRHDFNNCEANVKLLKEYFEENQLDWTSDNLEIAFHALESSLAPVVESAPVTPSNNPTQVTATVVTPPPAVPTPAAAAAVPVVQPTPTAQAQSTVPANPAPVVPRPAFNGGLVPGETSSGSRPTGQQQQAPAITAELIRSWDVATMRKHMANPAMRPQIEAFLRQRTQPKK